MERVVLLNEVVEEAHALTLHVWPCADAWAAWRRDATGAPPAAAATAVPLLQRAQVAALLGTDASKDVRQRLAGRRASAATGVRHAYGVVRSPYGAACEVRTRCG
jgi:hypothetical protein